MSFQGRLDAVARRAREAGYLSTVPPCGFCGWPRPRAARFVVVPVKGDEQPATCRACGNHVDGTGAALGGSRSTIVLEGLRLEPRDQSFAGCGEKEL